jgi:regulatory protein
VVRVEVGGRPLLTVPAEVVVEFGLAPGMSLEPPLHARLCRAADAEAAYRTLLRFLQRRPFARRDLARRLVLRGHPPEAADQAVARATAVGLLNDETFARHYVQTRSQRGRGPARLRRELTQLGIPPVLTDLVLREEVPPDAERCRLVALAGHRAAQLSALERPVRFRRVVAYLARRGFTGPEVRQVVREVLL